MRGSQIRLHTITFRCSLVAVLLLALFQLLVSTSLLENVQPDGGRIAEGSESCEALTPDDTCLDKQWGISQISAPQAWQIASGNSDTIIAVLDTGIDQTHIDLAGKVIANINFAQSPTVDDVQGHGTHIAGIIGAIANNGTGIAGLAYNCSLMNVKVADDKGFCDSASVAEGIVWAVDNGAKVINISLTFIRPTQALEDAVNYAWNQGVVVVAASANDVGDRPIYPACYSNCIAVAATDASDSLAFGSSHNDWVDIAAPGVDIYSTLPDSKYGIRSGTSMAAAYTAGLAGLLITLVTDTNGNGLLNDEVRNIIKDSCDEIGIPGAGKGRINALRAVKQAVESLHPIELREFTSLQELEDWLEQDKTDATLYFTGEMDLSNPHSKYGYDCDDFAYCLQKSALAQGYLMSTEIIVKNGEQHMINSTIIGNKIYFIEPRTDEVWLGAYRD